MRGPTAPSTMQAEARSSAPGDTERASMGWLGPLARTLLTMSGAPSSSRSVSSDRIRVRSPRRNASRRRLDGSRNASSTQPPRTEVSVQIRGFMGSFYPSATPPDHKTLPRCRRNPGLPDTQHPPGSPPRAGLPSKMPIDEHRHRGCFGLGAGFPRARGKPGHRRSGSGPPQEGMTGASAASKPWSEPEAVPSRSF